VRFVLLLSASGAALGSTRARGSRTMERCAHACTRLPAVGVTRA
jgi:hypothetical protein